jgi:UDP-N-acetylglucosamine transferase subunit ALG13
LIFITVGLQLPFDRLIKALDQYAETAKEECFAQIGDGRYLPTNMPWKRALSPIEFDEIIPKARLIVSHAGVGTILAAQRNAKPIVIFPRQAALAEHRNDHQLATASALHGRPGIYVAETVEELQILLGDPLYPAAQDTRSEGRQEFVRSLSAVINSF